MKNTLRISILIGLIWLAGLAYQNTALPHFLLDGVLPPQILAATTNEERIYIMERLRIVSAPSYISWIGVSSLIILSSYALWAAKRNEKK